MRQASQINGRRPRGRTRKGAGERNYESQGPDVKIRGTAAHVAEKYQQLARDAMLASDTVIGENYSQHAEHYLRIAAANLAADSADSQNDEPAEAHRPSAQNRAGTPTGLDSQGDTKAAADGQSDFFDPRGIGESHIGARDASPGEAEEREAPRQRRTRNLRTHMQRRPRTSGVYRTDRSGEARSPASQAATRKKRAPPESDITPEFQ